jgi:zinc-ribbon domain
VSDLNPGSDADPVSDTNLASDAGLANSTSHGSETDPGGGFWQASDGKWYPPASHPQASQAGLPASQPISAPTPGFPTSNPPLQYGAVQMAPQRFCQACGNPLVQTAATCPQCGTPAGAPRSKGVAILLAVFLGGWTWLYTYKRDAKKFWIGFGMAVVGAILAIIFIGYLFFLAIWIWAIVDTAGKSDSWYATYPNG